jgi:hypothetical protein
MAISFMSEASHYLNRMNVAVYEGNFWTCNTNKFFAPKRSLNLMSNRLYIGKFGALTKNDIYKEVSRYGNVTDFMMKDTYAFAVST